MARALFVILAENPDGSARIVGRASTHAGAVALAEKSLGPIDWARTGDGVTESGQRVAIEVPPGRTPPREEPIDFPRWDYVLESPALERYFGPALGFPLNKYGEIPYDDPRLRREYWQIWSHARSWLEGAIGQKAIRPYMPVGFGSEIYPSDVREIAEWASMSGEPWGSALSDALLAMLAEES